MIKNIFVFILLITLTTIAQSNNIKEIDSLRLEQKYQNLLSGNSNEIIPLYILGEFLNPYDSPFELEFLNNTNGNISELNSMSIQNIKNNMQESFAIYRLGQDKYHLGIVGEVLGYVGTVAAAGLAIHHVVKYKKMYGIK